MGREIVGGGAGRGGQQDAIADQLVEPGLAIDDDLDLGGLIGGAEQRDFVERQRRLGVARSVEHLHGQRDRCACAAPMARRCSSSSSEKVFIMKPTEPKFMP